MRCIVRAHTRCGGCGIRCMLYHTWRLVAIARHKHSGCERGASSAAPASSKQGESARDLPSMCCASSTAAALVLLRRMQGRCAKEPGRVRHGGEQMLIRASGLTGIATRWVADRARLSCHASLTREVGCVAFGLSRVSHTGARAAAYQHAVSYVSIYIPWWLW